MEKNYFRGMFVFLLLAGALLFSSLADARESFVLRLRWDHQFQFAGYYAANWKGYYKDEGLDVVIHSAFEPDHKFHKVTEEVANGAAHFGTGAVDILTARDQGDDLVVLASYFQKSPVAFYARSGTHLESPADLTRLKVATLGKKGIAEIELHAMLRAENIDPGRVKTQKIKEKLGLYDLAKGHADVVSGFTISAEWIAHELDFKLVKLRPASFGVNFYGSALFTHRRLLEKNPEAVRNFISASTKGWEYALNHPEEIATRIATALPRAIPLKDVEGFNRFQIEPVTSLTHYPVVELGHTNPARWKNMHEALLDAGVVTGSLDLQSFIYDPARDARIWETRLRNAMAILLAILLLIVVLFFTWSWFLHKVVANRSQALAEQELRYRDLIEGSIQGIAIIQNFTLMFSNSALAEMYGYDSPEEIIGLDTLEYIIHPDEQERIKAHHLARMRGEDAPQRYEFRGLKKDGSIIWLEGMARNVFWNGQRAAQVTYIDITERKRKEEELLTSQRLVQLVFDVIPFAVYVKDRDQRYLMANKKMLANRGVRPDEFKGMSTWDLPYLSEEQKKSVIESDKKVFETEDLVETFEVPITGVDGEIRFYNIFKNPFPDHEGNIIGLVAVSVDVTDFVQARNELQASRNMLQTIFDNIPIGIQVRGKSNEKIFVNKARAERIGMTPEEFIKSPDMVPKIKGGETIRDIEGMHREVIEKGHKLEITRLWKYQGMTDRWIRSIRVPWRDQQGDISGVIVVSEDITELKLAEEQQRRSDELIQTFVTNAPIILWGLDQQGMITLSEGKGLDQQGFKPGELVGQSVFEIYGDNPEFLKNVARALAGEAFRAVNETRGFFYERWFEPIKDEHGEVTGVIGISTDITEQVKLENQLRQAQKMEAIGHLAGGVAHDFNNLLQIINGYSELAKRKAEEGEKEEIANDLKKVIKASLSASHVTRQLLLFSRQQTMNLTSLDLNEVVDTMFNLLSRLLGADINFEVVNNEQSLLIHADRGMIEQVIMNLCVNARDAMADGGNLTIRTSHRYADRAFCSGHDWAQPGNYALISVSDSGEGISQDSLQKIFEPFYTTKEVGKGTGLGLSVVYGIVQQHHGDISVTSEPGVGSTFNIFLPLSGELEDKSEIGESHLIVGGNETILVAEDEPGVQEFIVNTLENRGYTVFTASEGIELFDVFDKISDTIDLVMLDLSMPNMNLKNAYEHIQKTKPSLPVLLNTGYSINTLDPDFLGKENLDILQKPFSTAVLLRTIREKLDRTMTAE